MNFNRDEVEEAAWVSFSELKDTLIHQNYSLVPGYKLSQTLNSQNNIDIARPSIINTRALYPIYRYNPMR